MSSGTQKVGGALEFEECSPDPAPAGKTRICRVGGQLFASSDGGPYLTIGGSCGFNDPAPSALRVVRLAATGNVASLSGATTLDQVATVDQDRVLLALQTDKTQNGIWVVNHSGAWTRPTDFNASGQATAGTAIFVTSGNANRYSTWRLTNLGAISPGTTSLVIKPVSVDFDTTVGNGGTLAQVAVASISISMSG